MPTPFPSDAYVHNAGTQDKQVISDIVLNINLYLQHLGILQKSPMGVELASESQSGATEAPPTTASSSSKRTVYILPPDVLSRILVVLVDRDEPLALTMGRKDPKEARNFSQVCHQFRSIALDCPKAWCSVWSGMNDFWLQTCVSRSKDFGLEIFCHMWPGTFQGARSLTRFLPYQHLWRSVFINYGLNPGDSAKVRKLYAHLDLPMLEKLSIQYNDLDENKMPEFYSSWMMPKLRAYEGWEEVPSAKIVSHLTSLKVVSMAFFGSHSKVLFPLLKDCQRLRRLTICMATFHWDNQQRFDRKVRLPCLTDFCLRTIGDPPVKALTQYLELPALTHLEVDFPSDCLASRIKQLVKLGDLQNTLISFTVTIYEKKSIDPKIMEAIALFKNVKHLVLRFSAACFTLRPTQATLPKLETLRFDFWEQFDGTYLAPFIAAHLPENGGSLKRVEIVGRDEMLKLKRVVREQLPLDMVTWRVDKEMAFGEMDPYPAGVAFGISTGGPDFRGQDLLSILSTIH